MFTSLTAVPTSSLQREIYVVRRDEVRKRILDKTSPATAATGSPGKATPTKPTPDASVVEFEDSRAVSGVKDPGAYTDQTLGHTPVVDRRGNVLVQPTGKLIDNFFANCVLLSH